MDYCHFPQLEQQLRGMTGQTPEEIAEIRHKINKYRVYKNEFAIPEENSKLCTYVLNKIRENHSQRSNLSFNLGSKKKFRKDRLNE